MGLEKKMLNNAEEGAECGSLRSRQFYSLGAALSQQSAKAYTECFCVFGLAQSRAISNNGPTNSSLLVRELGLGGTSWRVSLGAER